MTSNQPLISRVASDVLTGYYKRKRLTQKELADLSGIALPTLQKKLAAEAPITATDLVVLSRAMRIDPAVVITEIEKEAAVSEAPASLDAHRRKKKPSEMTEEELDAFEGEQAADNDPGIGHDEPEAP